MPGKDADILSTCVSIDMKICLHKDLHTNGHRKLIPKGQQMETAKYLELENSQTNVVYPLNEYHSAIRE